MNTVLSIEDLKNYKEQNPIKFEQKFADLDLDNIPAGFNSMTYRKEVIKGTHKKYLKDLTPKVAELEPEEVTPPRDDPDGEQNEGGNVEGGNTLEDNKEE